MDDLPLLVEGIQNKVKKLVARNKQLHQQVSGLQEQKQALQEEVEAQRQRIDELRQGLINTEVARLVEEDDAFGAKQKINELLREIEKCYVLLNR
ncbi:MAG: hypothetical protein R6U62_10735 [Bacteroidales bacterium]